MSTETKKAERNGLIAADPLHCATGNVFKRSFQEKLKNWIIFRSKRTEFDFPPCSR
ncbi:hypothetical protein LptCag_2567 [Leptospirillum ferriphilum]|uniref:Uncharacterized protein n=1 Tax=Leptospirillum ferriphilum TaxID=178606 RepID=A0A094WC57_9BACT|nr:hypothetical protein LptCag_2567 [Leptospirillum ferriphilum]